MPDNICPECRSHIRITRNVFWILLWVGLIVMVIAFFLQLGSIQVRDELTFRYNNCSNALYACQNPFMMGGIGKNATWFSCGFGGQKT